MPSRVPAATAALVLLLSGVFTWARADQNTGPRRMGARVPEDTPELIVFLRPGADAHRLAGRHNLGFKRALRSGASVVVLSAPSIQAARASRRAAALDPAVFASYINRRTCYVPMAFVPDDPYFLRDTPQAGWPGQWHLLNGFTPGLDAGVQGAWNRDVTGAGVVIGFVDDGLQSSHEDLASNYDASNSWDFGQGDANPGPVYSTDQHGIAVAGVAAARGGNGIGVTGAAPHASLAGLRIDFAQQTTQMLVDATLFHSSGAETGIKIKNHSYGVTEDYIDAPAEVMALAMSTASGTIHCFAAGNSSDDANKQELAKSPDAITVAALGSNGLAASYSNFGTCVSVTAPSSSSALLSITTTDRTASFGYNQNTNDSDAFPDTNYTSTFGGTSAATPIVAGVMALARQAQPALNTRFAKHLLARTCTMVQPADSLWTTNAAGIHFNPKFGFGLINADALTQLATQYAGVTPLSTEDIGPITVNHLIPDADTNGLVRTFQLGSSTPLEEIVVYLKVAHTSRGQISAYLISPDGLRSRLLERNAAAGGTNIDWTFTTNQFWGEDPRGTWTVQVCDTLAAFTGTWEQFGIAARLGSLAGGCPSRPVVTSVTPGTGPRLQALAGVVIQGSNFAPGQTVKLTSPAGPGVQGADVAIAPNGQSLTCNFDLSAVPEGLYNVVVTQPGCPNARLPDAFTVTAPACPGVPAVTSINPSTAPNDRDLNTVLIEGGNFVAGQTRIKLTLNGQPDIRATDVIVAPDGNSVTCDMRLYGVTPGAWDVIAETLPYCTASASGVQFVVTAGSTPPLPIAFSENWDAYAVGTSDAVYVARWNTLAGADRYSIEGAHAGSAPNALAVPAFDALGIVHPLAPELNAALAGSSELLALDNAPLELQFDAWLETADVDRADLFVELSKGDVYAPAGSSSAVLPVLALGFTHGINGAAWHPWYFDGQHWREVTPINQDADWNVLLMRVRSFDVFLQGSQSAAGSGTYPRAYTGGFDRVSVRTVSNAGSARGLDDIHVNGGWVVIPAPVSPPVILQAPISQTYCGGGPVIFTISASGQAPLTYQWQKDAIALANGGHYSGTTTPTLTIFSPDASDAGMYRCIVSNAGGSTPSEAASLGPAVRADLDGDCDVDMQDFYLLASCTSGAAIVPVSGCEPADLDRDGDVDHDDFGMYQRCFSGDAHAADPACEQ